MQKLSYRSRFLLEMAVIWVFIAVINSSYHIQQIFFKNNSSYSLDVLYQIALHLLIWLGVFCIQSAFFRFAIIRRPFAFYSSLAVLGAIVLFVLISLIGTALVPRGSPIIMMLMMFLSLFQYDAEKAQYGYFMLFFITPLLFYMHACILLYDEKTKDTEFTKLIRAVKQTWLFGVIVNGLAGSVFSEAVSGDSFFFLIFMWSCWFFVVLILSTLMRFSLPDRVIDIKSQILLFLASYGLASVFFYFFNYIPSVFVFAKSLASFGFGNRYYFLSGALFNIVASVLLLFFLYRMHFGILDYDEDGVYDEDVALNSSRTDMTRNNGGYNREIYRINSAAEWATEEGWDLAKKTESENRVTYSTWDNAEGKRAKEKDRLIQIGAVIWLLGWFMNLGFALWFGFFRWSFWFVCILMPSVVTRFVFFKRPTRDWKNKILLFFAGYVVVSVVFFAFGIHCVPSAILLIQMFLFPALSPEFSYRAFFSIGALLDLLSTTFLLSAFFYLHSAILSYGSDKEEVC